MTLWSRSGRAQPMLKRKAVDVETNPLLVAANQDILSALPSDPITTKHISADGWWSTDPNGLLLLNNRIYVPSAGNLCTHVLQYNHDHILARHFGQNKTLELVRRRYFWPSLCADVQQFCKFCVTCMQSKPQRHKPYGSLKQLPIPERP